MGKRTASMLALSAMLAVGAQAAPVQAAATTWTVVNPNADGSFTASGPLTVKNAAGQALFTCSDLSLNGEMASQTIPYGDVVGRFSWSNHASCFGSNGREWRGILYTGLGNYFRATAFNAATGTTTVMHTGATPLLPIHIFSEVGADSTCGFVVTSAAGTYSNATSTLKTTTAQTKLVTRDGVPLCQGVLAEGETVTFDGAFEFDPAITITATG